MAAMLNWWRPQKSDGIDEEQKYNPFTEVGLLTGHQCLVELVETIDYTRFLSASIDGIAIVWNAKTGAILGRLESHTHKITSVLVLPAVREGNFQDGRQHNMADDEGDLLVTAAFDGIKFWRLPTLDGCGEVHRPLMSKDEGAVCLRGVDDQMFCSGGGSICLWNRHGELLCEYKDNELLNIGVNGLAVMRSFELTVVALSTISNECSLDVWNIYTPDSGTAGYRISYAKEVKTPHTGRIEALYYISDRHFATRCSLPPAQVILWSTISVTRVMLIDIPSLPKQPSSKDVPLHDSANCRREATCVVSFSEKFLLIGLESGFQIFNTAERCKGNAMMPQVVTDMATAQGSAVSSACITANGHILVTASRDGRIKFWATSKSTSYRFKGSLLQDLVGSSSQGKAKLSLVGEVQWHHEQIKDLCAVSKHSFVAIGSENELVMWMDRELERTGEEMLARFLKQKQLL